MTDTYVAMRIYGEGPGKYRPGGFHPVYLGNVLDGRYHVFRKLGSGSQSTVWLARDSSAAETCRFVAVKVFDVESGAAQQALDEMMQPASGHSSHPGQNYVEKVLDSFVLEGPNGSHYCRVLEPLGDSLGVIIATINEERIMCNMPEFWFGNAPEGDRWSVCCAKRICWQLLSGLNYLHSQKIAHRDIRPYNVFTALQHDLCSLSENEIQRDVWGCEEGEAQETEEQQNNDKVEEDKEEADAEDEEADVEDEEADVEDEEADVEDEEADVEDEEADVEDEEEEEDDEEVEEEGAEGADDDEADQDSAHHSGEEQRQEEWRQKWEEQKKRREVAKQLIKEKWEIFEPGDKLAAPHSAEWNKANFINSKDDIGFVVRIDGQLLTPNEAEYTVAPASLSCDLDFKKPLRVVLGDLGFSCTFDQCDKLPLITQRAFMPPESLLKMATTHKADIFSMGLLCWQTVMIEHLVLPNRHNFENIDDDDETINQKLMCSHIRDLASRLTPVPSELQARLDGRYVKTFLDEGGKPLGLGTLEPGDFMYGDIWDQARQRKPLDMSDKDLEVFVGLIKEMLNWDPESRPSASELLHHEWFKGLEERI